MSEICGDRAYFCKCRAKPGHKGVHGCFGYDNCKGTWTYDDDGMLVTVTDPLAGQTFEEWFGNGAE